MDFGVALTGFVWAGGKKDSRNMLVDVFLTADKEISFDILKLMFAGKIPVKKTSDTTNCMTHVCFYVFLGKTWNITTCMELLEVKEGGYEKDQILKLWLTCEPWYTRHHYNTELSVCMLLKDED